MSSSEAVDEEILKDLSTTMMGHESLFRRDVFLDMMHRQIFLAFGKWVSIPKDDVVADESGRIRFNTYNTRVQLEVGLDEFKERIGNIALMYSFKPEVKVPSQTDNQAKGV